MLVDNFSQWQANAGRVQSIDLQYSRQGGRESRHQPRATTRRRETK